MVMINYSKQMLTDALIRGQQATHEENVSGVPFSPSPPPPKKHLITG